MNRKEYNLQLIEILFNYIKDNHDVRFSQALMNLYYVKQIPVTLIDDTHFWQDEFYLESKDLLDRILKAKV